MVTVAKKKRASSCGERCTLQKRALLSSQEASQLQRLFKVLGNDTRLRLLHALELAGELCVSALSEQLEMKPQAISNQLQKLTNLGMVAPRRDGNNIYYRISNSCVAPLLDLALCLTEADCGKKKK